MSKTKTTIEINGQRYDATTGALIRHGGGLHLDGIKPITPALQTAAPKPSSVARRLPHPSKAHTPQPSFTLMRQAVRKPAPGPRLTARQPADGTVALAGPKVAKKAAAHRVDHRRLSRAEQIAKSRHISRFDHHTFVAPQPAVSLEPLPVMTPRTPQTARRLAAPKNIRTTADILELALQQASGHETKLTPRQRRSAASRRITSISAATLSVIVLAGVIAYQNATSIKLQFASAKAGFAVSLPNKQPAGYRLSHLNYQNGLAAFDFQSNTDDRAYTIVEKASPWNSQALRDSFVANNKDYQSVSLGGRTVYLYGPQNATWVDGGVWYTVETNGALSNRQLVDLAASL